MTTILTTNGEGTTTTITTTTKATTSKSTTTAFQPCFSKVINIGGTSKDPGAEVICLTESTNEVLPSVDSDHLITYFYSFGGFISNKAVICGGCTENPCQDDRPNIGNCYEADFNAAMNNEDNSILFRESETFTISNALFKTGFTIQNGSLYVTGGISHIAKSHESSSDVFALGKGSLDPLSETVIHIFKTDKLLSIIGGHGFFRGMG